MKYEWKYPENVEMTLRRLDEKIEEIKEWWNSPYNQWDKKENTE